MGKNRNGKKPRFKFKTAVRDIGVEIIYYYWAYSLAQFKKMVALDFNKKHNRQPWVIVQMDEPELLETKSPA